jgi:hypothetical protein
MASLTVRQLDDRLKKLLRLRAARNNRSMEDEIRVSNNSSRRLSPCDGSRRSPHRATSAFY